MFNADTAKISVSEDARGLGTLMFDIFDNKCSYRAIPNSEDGVFLYMSYQSCKNEVSDIPQCPSFPATDDILETSARNLETFTLPLRPDFQMFLHQSRDTILYSIIYVYVLCISRIPDLMPVSEPRMMHFYPLMMMPNSRTSNLFEAKGMHFLAVPSINSCPRVWDGY